MSEADPPALKAIPVTAASSRPRLGWVDCTRGVAIVGVVLYHTFGALRLTNVVNGQTGVDAFLMLSGFGLAYAVRPESTGRFLLRRFARLLPAYWIVLGLCAGFEAWRGAPASATQLVLNATCLHLIAGPPHGFAINMSFWFMGLIVPLYLAFALVRRWLVRGAGYGVLGVAIAAAWAAGVWLYLGIPWWEIGHVPHRLPLLFVGAVLGVAVRRGDGFDRLAREPMLMAAVVLLVPVSLSMTLLGFPISVAAGFGVIALGAMIASAADRWRAAKPVAALATGLGAISYELFLCHQYLLVTVGPELVSPRLAARFPSLTAGARDAMTALLMLAVALWVAWVVRWLVAPRESRRTWRPTLATAGIASAALLVAAAILPPQAMNVRPRTFRVAVTVPSPPPASAVTEPLVGFGHPKAADLVVLGHDGLGRVRIGVEHMGTPPVWSGWAGAAAATARPVEVTIDTSAITVRAGDLTARSPGPPHVPNAKPTFGRNDVGLKVAILEAVSEVRRLPGPTTGLAPTTALSPAPSGVASPAP
ncbi:MAG: acyltransferase [Phycisphaerales bacterium]|nr:acyltransferase [Phycisphaerales bacterium]